MRKLILALLFLGACYAPKPADYHYTMAKTKKVYVDKYWTWANSAGATDRQILRSSLRKITVRVVSWKYVDVEATITCKNEDNSVFGERTVIVEARGDKTVIVSGFARGYYTPETVSCEVSKWR